MPVGNGVLDGFGRRVTVDADEGVRVKVSGMLTVGVGKGIGVAAPVGDGGTLNAAAFRADHIATMTSPLQAPSTRPMTTA